MATQQKRQGFMGHGNYGQYSGDYVATIKDMAKFGKQTAGRQGFNQMMRYQSKKQIENAIDSGDVSFNMGLVPEKYKGMVEDFIKRKAREKGELEIRALKLKESGQVQSPEYQDIKMKADAIRRMLGDEGSLTTAWKDFQTGTKDFLEDKTTGAISLMSGSDNEWILSQLYSNSLDLMIDDDSGALSFGNEENGYTLFKEMPKYFNSDYTNAGKILGHMDAVYKSGSVLSDQNELFYTNEFSKILREGGNETILSLGFDKLFSENTLLNEDDYEQEIEDLQSNDATVAGAAYDKLKTDLTNAYLELLRTQAQTGFDAKNITPPSGGGGRTVNGKKVVNVQTGDLDMNQIYSQYGLIGGIGVKYENDKGFYFDRTLPIQATNPENSTAKEMLAKFTDFLKKNKLIGEDETHTDFLNKENSNELLQEKFKAFSLMKFAAAASDEIEANRVGNKPRFKFTVGSIDPPMFYLKDSQNNNVFSVPKSYKDLLQYIKNR